MMKAYTQVQLPGWNGESGRGFRAGGFRWERIFRLRGRAMLGVFVLVGAALAAWAVWRVPAEYVASSPVEITGQEGIPWRQSVEGLESGLKRPSLLKEALGNSGGAASGLESTAVWRQGTRRIHLTPAPDEGVVWIRFHYPEPDAAEHILDALLAAYSATAASEVQEAQASREQAASSREEEVARRIADLDEQIAKLRQGLSPEAGLAQDSPETEASRLALGEAERARSEALTAQQNAEHRAQRVTELLGEYKKHPEQAVHVFDVESRVGQDPGVAAVMAQLTQARREAARLESLYLNGAPPLTLAQAERDELEVEAERIKAETRRAVLEAVRAEAKEEETLHAREAELAMKRRDELLAVLEARQAQFAGQNEKAAQLKTLREERSEALAEQRMAREEAWALRAKAGGAVQVRVLEKATASERPSQAGRIVAVLAGLLLAGALALLAGVALEFADRKIWSVEDIERVASAPVFSALPDIREDRLPAGTTVATLADRYSGSATADQVRRAMARMLSGAPGKTPIRTCLVTSPGPGEGKTSFACNLAICLAQAGRTVLLVDLNGAHPGVEQAFGMTPAPGLAEVLKGEGVEHRSEHDTGIENLYVLGPGSAAHSLPEQTGAWIMHDFFTGAKRLFDHIIVDSPAVLASSEARILAPLVEGILLVVAAGKTTFDDAAQALRVLDAVGGNVAGFVVNGLTPRTEARLKKDMDHFYREAETLPAKKS